MICSHPISTVFLRQEPVDFRKGMDGLIGMCANELSKNPRSGAAFVFCNKSQKGIKVLYYDGQGYWLCQKRFSEGRMKNWPTKLADARIRELNAQELFILIFDGNPSLAGFKKNFQPMNDFACNKQNIGVS
jgi:transposase